MPIVANSMLPSFARVQAKGGDIVKDGCADSRDMRDLHVGLMNMMPDAALEPTERQFLHFMGSRSHNIRIFVYPFSPAEIPRGEWAQEHVGKYYSEFTQLKKTGLDALIVTGANPVFATLSEESFWPPLCGVLDWAIEHVTSTLCACLASHAALLYFHGIERQPLPVKRWGVFKHRVLQHHPLLKNANSHFNVPHSRWNDISALQMTNAGLRVLVGSDDAGVHLSTSADGFRFVFFQGHPEYDNNSLLKEYKREVSLYSTGERDTYPPFPDHYFSAHDQHLLRSYAAKIKSRKRVQSTLAANDFPESDLSVENSWIDSGELVFNNWIRTICHVSAPDCKIPFKDGVDVSDRLLDFS